MVRVGDEVVVLPSGRRTTVAGIDTADGELAEAFAPMSVALRLADDIDVSRGDLIAAAAQAPEPTRDLVATLCWLSDVPLSRKSRLLLKHTTRTTRTVIGAVDGVLDLDSVQVVPGDDLQLNDIGRVRLRTAEPIVAEPYARHRRTGAFLLIDSQSGQTLAAGMIGDPLAGRPSTPTTGTSEEGDDARVAPALARQPRPAGGRRRRGAGAGRWRSGPACRCASCHLDFTDPAPDVALRRMAADGFTSVRVVPLLFTPGYHVTHDVPEAIEASGVAGRMDVSVAPALVSDEPRARGLLLRALGERLTAALPRPRGRDRPGLGGVQLGARLDRRRRGWPATSARRTAYRRWLPSRPRRRRRRRTPCATCGTAGRSTRPWRRCSWPRAACPTA